MLEEKNTSYMEKSVEWEEESKKTSTLRSQIEVYKRQVIIQVFINWLQQSLPRNAVYLTV